MLCGGSRESRAARSTPPDQQLGPPGARAGPGQQARVSGPTDRKAAQMLGEQPQPTAPAHHPVVPASLKRPPLPTVQRESADFRPFCCAWPSEVTSPLGSPFLQTRNGVMSLDDLEGHLHSDLVKTTGIPSRASRNSCTSPSRTQGPQRKKVAKAESGQLTEEEASRSREHTEGCSDSSVIRDVRTTTMDVTGCLLDWQKKKKWKPCRQRRGARGGDVHGRSRE